jgi:phosphate transport system substrate-binding protein
MDEDDRPTPAQDNVRLTGSGATFPFPIYSTWFKSFSGKSKGVTVDYQGKGSGAGPASSGPAASS